MSSLTLLFSRTLGAGFPPPEAGVWAPPVDVVDRRGELVVEVECPGATPGDVRASCDGRSLVVEGIKPGTVPPLRADAVARFLRVERDTGPFRRVIPLPWTVDRERSRARLAGGVLTVVLFRAGGER